MEIRIDENGKYFTTHVNKAPQRIVAHTTDQFIIGTIHLQPEQRLIDALNIESAAFLAITDAQVYTKDGTQLFYTGELVIVACAHIIALSPVALLVPATDALWSEHLSKEAS